MAVDRITAKAPMTGRPSPAARGVAVPALIEAVKEGKSRETAIHSPGPDRPSGPRRRARPGRRASKRQRTRPPGFGVGAGDIGEAAVPALVVRCRTRTPRSVPGRAALGQTGLISPAAPNDQARTLAPGGLRPRRGPEGPRPLGAACGRVFPDLDPGKIPLGLRPRAGVSANLAIPALIEALRDDSNTGIANHAEEILPAVRQGSPPRVARRVQRRPGPVHGRVAVVLGAIDLSIDRVVPALLATMRDPTSTARTQAALMVAPKGEAVVPDLIASLKDTDDETRGLAGVGIGQIGPAAAAAVPLSSSD